ncbi:hypothetical protein V1508DRAFT_411195 [Lipomyces doorenjongii]|uniref:uncharacterized protein n=1 Tax=Lipomyces doorenjongii TaxID=383834 RepID=UPI0034CE0781
MAPILPMAAITSNSSFSPARSSTVNPSVSLESQPAPLSGEPRQPDHSPVPQRGHRLPGARRDPGELPADQEIDAIVARISAKHAVRGVIVVDMEQGGIVRSSMIDADGGGVILGKSRSRGAEQEPSVAGSRTEKVDEEEGDSDLVAKYAAICVQFVKAASDVVDEFFEEDDDLKLLRLRTKEHGLMIVPDSRFILVVIHDVHAK